MGRMIGAMVKDIGYLMIDDIVRYQTAGEMIELGGGALGMKYRTLVLNDKVRNGSKKNVILRFTDRWAGKKLSEEDIETMSVALYEEGGAENEIYEVNPAIWSRLEYLIIIEPDQLLPKNDAFERAIRLETYDRAIQNPLIINDPERLADVTRDFLFAPTVKGEAAKYIPKDTQRALQGFLPNAGQLRKGVTSRVMESGAMEGLLTA